MAERVPARLTAAHGRRFGLTVGTAFLVLAAIMWWRGHEILRLVFAVPGVALWAGGLLAPTALGPVERGWMALAHAISKVTTPIVMAVMYAGVLTPIGFLRRSFGGNPMVHPASDYGFWKHRAAGRSSSMRRQF
jgi:hypothetical protein